MTAVRYFVSDVDRSVDFYTTHLGFALARRVGVASAVVVRGDVTLWLTHADPLNDAKPGGWNRLILEVDALSSRVAAFKDAGCLFRYLIGPGGTKAIVKDPDGNSVELLERSSKQHGARALLGRR